MVYLVKDKNQWSLSSSLYMLFLFPLYYVKEVREVYTSSGSVGTLLRKISPWVFKVFSGNDEKRELVEGTEV